MPYFQTNPYGAPISEKSYIMNHDTSQNHGFGCWFNLIIDGQFQVIHDEIHHFY